jgi:hypothetical protein
MSTGTGRDWTGNWDTNYGKVELEQTGNAVTGVYVLKQGRINGQASNGRLAGTWAEAPSYAPPNDAGDFEIHLDQYGRSFKGKWWKVGAGKEHEWTGLRV